jgi:hypothetical protein
MAGTKGNSGRKKGVPNKRTQSVIDQLVALDCDPIEGMASIARKAMDEGELILAGSMYKELAQYVAPKRKSIEVSGEMELDVVQDVMVGFRDVPLD